MYKSSHFCKGNNEHSYIIGQGFIHDSIEMPLQSLVSVDVALCTSFGSS